MDFLVRILFSGLIAFVPSTDGKELTVLLLDAHAARISDGTSVAHHQPMLLARAQSCAGDCNRRDARIAQFLFAGQSRSEALDALAGALDGGGAWPLNDVELLVRKTGAGEKTLQPPLLFQTTVNGSKKSVPANSREREDFGWVPNLKHVLPSFGELNPALFESRPPKSIVAARLRLKSGKFFTYRLIRIDDQVVPVNFRALRGNDVPYSQAVAGWVAAEIRVPGNAVEVVARNFDDKTERTMKLTPRDGVVEMAILNLPPFQAPPAGVRRAPPEPGKHFEMYYALAKSPPEKNQRPVPYLNDATMRTAAPLKFDDLHPRDLLKSPLLDGLQFELDRGPYDVVLCPVGQAPQP